MSKKGAKTQILNISSNLRRIAQWAYEEPNEARLQNIENFLAETEKFMNEVDKNQVAGISAERFEKFSQEFPKLKERFSTAFDNRFRRLVWAEEILTWSNLL